MLSACNLRFRGHEGFLPLINSNHTRALNDSSMKRESEKGEGNVGVPQDKHLVETTSQALDHPVKGVSNGYTLTKENEELRAAVARQTRKRDEDMVKKVFLAGKGLARVQAAQHGMEGLRGRMNRQPAANVI
ncbi:hypothetical protein PAAG_07602 [Paracoccidioides lutzii Pb01]|uniref:Uncharacterized protein n=1 Tax=Paracoccidioides lutzii (strain ATCC MYA-826 / Pb01) TaxID=502779 RepID=C1HAE8_PARBA|nr:hypothetical protein PAAG_07602 [Paracoccidioides lutzii Pb01]EEH37321.2 hypothetical protein PAAG_07602 [Paracoccidioides lutzii Pb01]